MRRRDFVRAIVGSAAAWPLALLLGTSAALAFDSTKIGQWGSLYLDDLLPILAKSAQLKQEVTAALTEKNKKPEDILCFGMRFPGAWKNLGGTRVAPYTCDFDGKYLRIDATVRVIGHGGRTFETINDTAMKRATDVSETNLTWQWTTGDDPAKGPPWSVRFAPTTPAEKAANDTTAELATGGLIFTKSDGIEMISEDLFISMKEVRVKYRFFNHSDQDITTQVAFPMPDLPYGVDNFNFVIPTNDPENILAFTTTVDNQPVAALVERKAFLDGKDETEVLRSVGVPIAPQLNQKYDYLSQDSWSRLIRAGLIQDTPRTLGHLQPRWTLKTTYYWQQTFPAHQEVSIDHRYGPSVWDGLPMTASDLFQDARKLGIGPSTDRFCINSVVLNAMDRTTNLMWERHILEYILTTDANWSGPIKDFRLVVDKESTNNLVSFCAQGVRKIGPTQIEIRISNFMPTSNLSILILSPTHSPANR